MVLVFCSLAFPLYNQYVKHHKRKIFAISSAPPAVLFHSWYSLSNPNVRNARLIVKKNTKHDQQFNTHGRVFDDQFLLDSFLKKCKKNVPPGSWPCLEDNLDLLLEAEFGHPLASLDVLPAMASLYKHPSSSYHNDQTDRLFWFPGTLVLQSDVRNHASQEQTLHQENLLQL